MRITFSDFELDTERYLLQYASCGGQLRLRPKVFDLLIYLVTERSRVVPRAELVDFLWGATAVGEGSLSGLVNELRKGLGERGDARSSVRTVHARGYQFVAEVTSEIFESPDQLEETMIGEWRAAGRAELDALFERNGWYALPKRLVDELIAHFGIRAAQRNQKDVFHEQSVERAAPGCLEPERGMRRIRPISIPRSSQRSSR